MRAVYDGFGAMYPQLRALASSLMSRERMSHTLQPTAVVSEAFLRLADRRGADFESESHLLAFEVWPDAFESAEARAVLAALARAQELRLSHRDGSWSVFAPDEG